MRNVTAYDAHNLDTPSPVRRVALLVEREDGVTAVLYAEAGTASAVNVSLTTEPAPVVTQDWARPGDGGWSRTIGPPTYGAAVAGLEGYVLHAGLPGMVKATLDSIRNAVTL